MCARACGGQKWSYTDNCGLICESLALSSGPLQEPNTLVTAEPSLQIRLLFWKKLYMKGENVDAFLVELAAVMYSQQTQK